MFRSGRQRLGFSLLLHQTSKRFNYKIFLFFFSDRECNYSTVSIMGLPQHSGDFSTFRLISPVQETSYSQLLLLPHLVQRKIGMRVASTVFVSSFGAALIQFCPLGFPLSFVRFGFGMLPLTFDLSAFLGAFCFPTHDTLPIQSSVKVAY